MALTSKIFYDRVRAQVPGATHVVLAHVLVHEITPILQGVVHHSESGFMKAHWTAEDYTAKTWQPLSFTPGDIDLIRRGFTARATIMTGHVEAANPGTRAQSQH